MDHGYRDKRWIYILALIFISEIEQNLFLSELFLYIG